MIVLLALAWLYASAVAALTAGALIDRAANRHVVRGGHDVVHDTLSIAAFVWVGIHIGAGAILALT